MFRNWATAQPFGLRSIENRAGRRSQRIQITLLLLFLTAVLPPGARDRAEEVTSGEQRRALPSDVPQTQRAGTLRLGAHYGDVADAERLRKAATDLLTLVACVNDFDCRLSIECLTRGRPAKLTLDGPFEDVLLDLPVRGDAHVEGTLRIASVHDAGRAAFDVFIEGTARLKGAGQTRGVRIQSDASTRFRAAKRVFVDHLGMTCGPATCHAETSLAIAEITSNRPKILGRFAERVARQRVTERRSEAQAECSAHVIQALRAALDREFDRLAGTANAALAEHLAAGSDADKARWQQVRFHTEADCLHIARHVDSQALLTAWKPAEAGPAPAVWLRLPHAKLDVMAKLASLGCLGLSATGASPDAGAVAAKPPSSALRPTVSWHEGTLTVAIDFEPLDRLAREPVIGAVQ